MIKFFQDICEHPKSNVLLELVEATCTSITKVRTCELKHGQWPQDPINDHESYTADECQLFVMWVLPIILNKLVANKHKFSSKQCIIGRFLVDIAHIFFNWSRHKGWSIEDLHIALQLLKKWRNLSEALDGPNGRSLEVWSMWHVLPTFWKMWSDLAISMFFGASLMRGKLKNTTTSKRIRRMWKPRLHNTVRVCCFKKFNYALQQRLMAWKQWKGLLLEFTML